MDTPYNFISIVVLKKSVIALIGLSLLGTFQFACNTTNKELEKPNFIFIYADNLGYGDIGCFGSKLHRTPSIDNMAKDGIRLTTLYSSSCVCTPSRASLMTGCYAQRVDMHLSEDGRWVLRPLSAKGLNPEEITIASLLKDNGYVTACIGKWHLGDQPEFLPLHHGFDYFYGIPASLDMIPYCYIENDRAVTKPTLTTEAGKASEDGWWRAGAIAPGFKHVEVLPRLTEKAVEYIDNITAKSPDRPFFMYFALPAPHCPIAPADFVKGRSKAGGYGDFVVEVDWTVGQVVKSLERNGLARNTLIIVTSDNGSPGRTKIKRDPYSIIEIYGHYPNGDLRGIKADIWDGGHREPFIARWPGNIPAGTTSDQIVCLTDLMATCAAIVGAELPNNAGEDSYNILPALLDKKLNKPIREAIVHHSSMGMFSIRQGKWKLILGLGSGGFSKPKTYKPKPGEPEGQLYNLEEDFAESRNLWSEQPQIVERLTSLLEKYKQQGRTRPL